MARVRLFGQEFNADLVKDNGDGTWQAISREHTGRSAPGTTITVSQSEIVEAAAAELPPSPAASQSALDAAMAKERETLPSPADLIAQHRGQLAEQGKLGEQQGQSVANPT